MKNNNKYFKNMIGYTIGVLISWGIYSVIRNIDFYDAVIELLFFLIPVPIILIVLILNNK